MAFGPMGTPYPMNKATLWIDDIGDNQGFTLREGASDTSDLHSTTLNTLRRANPFPR